MIKPTAGSSIPSTRATHAALSKQTCTVYVHSPPTARSTPTSNVMVFLFSIVSRYWEASQRWLRFVISEYFDPLDNVDGYAIDMANRFKETGDIADLHEAIAAMQEAVKLTPEGNEDLPLRLNNLGCTLMYRFEQTRDLLDIAGSISIHQRAVQLTPEGDADLAARLHSLGNSLLSRFERTGDYPDVAEALSTQRRAVVLTPRDHADLPHIANSLGISLMRHFEHTGDIGNVVESISILREAVQLMPNHHPEIRSFLNTLSISFLARYDSTSDVDDITESIAALQRAVALTPENHTALPTLLSNLGNSFVRRYHHTHDFRDIAKAISAQKQALELTPRGHPDLTAFQINLGNSLCRWSSIDASRDNVDASISTFKSAATCTSGRPYNRLYAATRWARLINLHDPMSNNVLPAFDAAIGLIALNAGLDETVQRRHTLLKAAAGLPLEAAATAVSLGRVEKAVEWLEQGRCLVWGQLNSLRTPLDDLRAHDSQLAQSIVEVSRRLEGAGSSRPLSHQGMSLSQKISMEGEARTHLALSRKWDDLLKTARAIPGFGSFLRPPSCSTLMQHLPEAGFVVVVNIDERRCDAIALAAGQDEPLHIPLPNFSIEKAIRYRDTLRTQLQSHGLRDREGEWTTISDVESTERPIRRVRGKEQGDEGIVGGVLRGLWIEVVKPILEVLCLPKMASTDQVPPRIWWCPTGPLSFLPIHAAGIYDKMGSESILDYAVSSYTPSISALTERVKKVHPIDPDVSGLFLTSQPNAPGAPPIPGTTKEVRSIYHIAETEGRRAVKLEGNAVTVDECLEYMERFSSIHLACHASQNAIDPLQSRFLFHDGTLGLATIIQRNLKNADLAYLSACQTSTGEEKLSDEAVHLAAGMLAAGYRSVVATMWSINDHHAPEVAGDFYQCLWGQRNCEGGRGFNRMHSSYALHCAIQKLRLRLSDNSEKSLLSWIPYVHFGH
ncbi:hypothetical protein D9611_001044 [Ephemerocybe angulata]|uniref:CHAT domain-containing protein n=1 Tax=Ephemerocybe angulata TaxID=980116 RepID=A0A8H5BPX2_9AGAR|nr:hypothetical protein D9611_001044 [Tulosesus angulatus]